MVVTRLLRLSRALRARVQQHEAACAIGVLGLARLEAALSEQSGLLVARDAGDGHARRHAWVARLPKDAARTEHLGHHGRRYVKEIEELLVPASLVDVVEHRATCVGDVGGVHEATREHPYEPGVHGAEEQLACIRPLAGAGDVSQDPRDLAGREVRIGEKSRLGANPIADLGRPADLVDERRRAPALPYDGVIDGLACGGIPHDGGLALVVDADGINLRRRETVPVHEFGERADLREEDVLRVVLDPAGLWEDLLERSLHAVDHASLVVDEHGARGGRPLVERDDEPLVSGGHGYSSPLLSTWASSHEATSPYTRAWPVSFRISWRMPS